MDFEPQNLTWPDVFPGSTQPGVFLSEFVPSTPTTFFVGPNGSGKTRTALAYAQRSGTTTRRLSTDRLAGVMSFQNYGWASVPQGNLRGIPVGGGEEQQLRSISVQGGIINDAFYILRENPDIYLRVGAVISRIFQRDMRLSESAGYIEPMMLSRRAESYSLLNDEGHGLRELIALLTFIYYPEPPILVIDEPELHLHPSMARFWLQELKKEFSNSGRRAIIITHEPDLIRPSKVEDLQTIWVFREGHSPVTLISGTDIAAHRSVIEGSLVAYPDIVSGLVFSPRPVLVEGVHDRAALETGTRRLYEVGISTQTDFIPCQGSSGVAAWFEIARTAGIDALAVADLDAALDKSFQRAMDRNNRVRELYQSICLAEPPLTSVVLRDLHAAMERDEISTDPKERARWLAQLDSSQGSLFHRKEALLTAWREAGVWLHPQGTLEDVLELPEKASVETARQAASCSGNIDPVVEFCRYQVETEKTLENTLLHELRRIVHEIQRELAQNPDLIIKTPIGATAQFDAKLADILPLGAGRYALLVKARAEFAGRRLEFSVDTPTTGIILQADPASEAP